VFCELPQLRIVTAVTVAAATCAYELAVSGISGDTLLFCLAMLVGSGALCWVFSGLFSWGVTMEDVLGRRTARPRAHSRVERIWMEAGVCALLFFTVYSLQSLSIFGLDLGYLFAAFATLYISRRFGALRGCAGGLIISMAVSTLYAPAFGLLGLLAGVLWPLGGFYAMGLGAAVGVAWCSYVGGLAGFLGVGPELTVATLISLPLLPRLYSDAIAGEVKQDRAAAEEAVRKTCEREEEHDRVAHLAEAFDALSRAFSERSTTPTREECFALCDEICTGYCTACPKRVDCWDSADRPAAAALDTLADRLTAGETFAVQDMPNRLISDCGRLAELLSDIRLAGAKLCRRSLRCVGADYPAPDYALTAELLGEAATADKRNSENDTVKAAAIRRLLSDKGIRPAAVRVLGGREKKIVAASSAFSGKQREAAQLISLLEEACGCRLSPPRFEMWEDVITMETHTAPRYALEVAYAGRAAQGSEVSGDCVGTFRAPDGYSYLLLSDGMGTGRAAARTAGMCAVFLEKMLVAGNSETTSLKMLNRLIALRGEECSATVDLLQFDTYWGQASFVKSGAAASYVRREGNLFRLRARTIPIGLVGDVDAEKLHFDTQAGDIIIMLSDGISQTSEDAPWLIELLSKPLGQNLEAAANGILEQTLQRSGGRDDMTVMLARVTSCP
jgi:stage II sporulation protein E